MAENLGRESDTETVRNPKSVVFLVGSESPTVTQFYPYLIFQPPQMSETDPLLMRIPDILTSFEDPEKVFRVLEPLGEGSYGSVYKAVHR